MSKPDTTKTFVDKYEDEIKKYFTNNLINKEIINEIPKEKYEKYENIFKDIYERKPENFENIFKSTKDQKIGTMSQVSYYLSKKMYYK
jgi:predicted oxidoreductase